MPRRSIEVDSLAHLAPIPVATRIGPLLVSSVIMPYDPHTRDLPDGIVAQVANLFDHATAILEAAAARWDDVAKMTFFVADIAYRDAINEPWTKLFPDPMSRPSRHTQLAQMGGPALVSCDLLAYVDS